MAIKLDPFDFVIQVCEKHDELANENAKTCPYCVINDLKEEIRYLEDLTINKEHEASKRTH